MIPVRDQKMYYTYVIKSRKDSKWYTGATRDLRERFSRHNHNEIPSTKGRGPFEIIYYEACQNEHDAFMREKYLKSGPGKSYLKNRLKRSLSLTGQVSSEKVHPVRILSRRRRDNSRLRQLNSNGGFIALISSIIISVLLLTIVVALNLTGFLGRFNILDSELKERSLSLAEGCVDIALLNLARNPNYTGGATVNVGDDSCNIQAIQDDTPMMGETTIKTKSVFRKAVTNLEIVADSGNLSIVSWKECALDINPCN